MDEKIKLYDLPLSGLKLCKRKPIADKRGALQRLYCQALLKENGIEESIKQINFTYTADSGVIRGMHFQHYPYAETKVVTVMRGKIFDVAIDLRKDSPTFLQWHAEILSPESYNSLLIPKGFAHGFQTLTEDCELLYLHTESYEADYEGGIHPMDHMIKINWPLEMTDISERDNNHPLLTTNFEGLFNEL